MISYFCQKSHLLLYASPYSFQFHSILLNSLLDQSLNQKELSGSVLAIYYHLRALHQNCLNSSFASNLRSTQPQCFAKRCYIFFYFYYFCYFTTPNTKIFVRISLLLIVSIYFLIEVGIQFVYRDRLIGKRYFDRLYQNLHISFGKQPYFFPFRFFQKPRVGCSSLGCFLA